MGNDGHPSAPRGKCFPDVTETGPAEQIVDARVVFPKQLHAPELGDDFDCFQLEIVYHRSTSISREDIPVVKTLTLGSRSSCETKGTLDLLVTQARLERTNGRLRDPSQHRGYDGDRG
jgi:hypothetical protein